MSLLRKSGINLIGLILPLAIGFATFPFVVHHYGLARFGVITIMWAFVSYFGIIDLGLSRVVVREIGAASGSGREDRAQWVTATAHAIAVASATCIAVALAILILVWPDSVAESADGMPQNELVNAAVTICALLPFTAGSAILRGELEGRQAFVHANTIRVATGIAIFLVPVLIAPWTTSIASVAVGFAVVRIVVWFGCLAAVRRVRGVGVRLFPDSFAGAGALLTMGGWMTVSTLITPLTAYVDRMVIIAMMSASALAIYAAANEAATKLGLVPGAVTTVLFPEFARRLASGEEVAELLVRAQTALLNVMLPIISVLSLTARPLFEWWLGAVIAADATRPFQILCVAMMISCMSQLPFVVCQSAGRARDVALAQVGLFILLVPALMLAVSRWGIEGAALAWLGRIVIDHVLMVYYARRALVGHVPDSTYVRLLGTSSVGASVVVAVSFAALNVSIVATLATILVCGAILLRKYRRHQLVSKP